ncbi:MAG: short-chain fatty acid transporter [Planctomycetota bacterium JB042]
MLARIAQALSRFSSRWVPDAWVIAVGLTGVTAALALGLTPSGPSDVVRHWGDGFWKFLTFAMQMCLVVMTGYMLSTAPPVRRLLERAADLATTPRAAVVLMAVVSLLLGWLHWGLSVAASAVLVRVVARRQPKVDYRLLVCCAYFGVATIWHAGWSGSAPTKVAMEGHEFVDVMGVLPVSESILNPFNLALVALVLVLMPFLAWRLHPPEGEAVCVDPATLDDAAAKEDDARERTPAGAIESSRIPNLLLAAAAGWWLVLEFRERGLDAVNIDTLNFTFLFLAVLAHGTPASFLRSASEAGRFVWGIAIQFPFYAGIAGILSGSGLSTEIAAAFESFATAETYPFFVLVYSGFLNYIVPSGGSQWIVSGEYLMQAANGLGVGTDKALIAYSWGDMSTNLVQPFWAIPLLAIAGLRFRDIMGFAVILFAVYFAVVGAAFLAFGWM